MENQFGKVSKLSLKVKKRDGKDIIRDLMFTAPFKVMYPFKEKGKPMQIIILSSSAGIMAGDEQIFHFTIEEDACAEIISQSYDKIHKMETGYATRKTQIKVGHNACLYYNPQPMIPFKDSDFISEMSVELKDHTSLFIIREILSCGRAVRGELFQYKRYQNSIQVRTGGKLVYRDMQCFEPLKWKMKTIGAYENFTHQASMVICNGNLSSEEKKNILLAIERNDEIEGGISETASEDLVIRILGNNAQILEKITQQIQEDYLLNRKK